ncbi:uncharacterized protein LOC134817315 [Bolinopsis microptera]
MEMAFFDIRVLHPGAKSNANHNTPAKMYMKHEREKERKYGDRCVQIEKGTCNGLVFSTTGVRGHRGRYYEKAIPVDELDLNLAHTTSDEDRGDDVDDEDEEVGDEVENVEEEVSEE